MMIPWLTPSMIVAGERQLDLRQHLHPRCPERRGRLDRRRGDAAQAVRDQPDHHRDRVEHRGDHAGILDTGIEVDERDDVDQLRKRLQRVEHGAQRRSTRGLSAAQTPISKPSATASAVATSTCDAVSIAGAQTPMMPIAASIRKA